MYVGLAKFNFNVSTMIDIHLQKCYVSSQYKIKQVITKLAVTDLTLQSSSCTLEHYLLMQFRMTCLFIK